MLTPSKAPLRLTVRNSTSIFTTELSVYSCRFTLFTLPFKFLLLTDPFSSPLAMRDLHSVDPIVQLIHVNIHDWSEWLCKVMRFIVSLKCRNHLLGETLRSLIVFAIPHFPPIFLFPPMINSPVPTPQVTLSQIFLFMSFTNQSFPTSFLDICDRSSFM